VAALFDEVGPDEATEDTSAIAPAASRIDIAARIRLSDGLF